MAKTPEPKRAEARDALAKSVGSRIAAARAARGLTSELLAKKAQVTRARLSVWENGRGVPDLLSLVRLGEALEVSYHELLDAATAPDLYVRLPDGTVAVVEIKRPTSPDLRQAQILIYEALSGVGTAGFVGEPSEIPTGVPGFSYMIDTGLLATAHELARERTTRTQPDVDPLRAIATRVDALTRIVLRSLGAQVTAEEKAALQAESSPRSQLPSSAKS